MLTPGNVDDRKPLREMTDGLFGKLYADKSYIAHWLTEFLSSRGIDFVTKVRRNMEPVARSDFDQAILR